jgi:preprotein translocase subunit Sec61beta
MKKQDVSAPAGGAGLIRYFDVDEGGPKMDPKLVIGVVVAIILLEILSSVLMKTSGV